MGLCARENSSHRNVKKKFFFSFEDWKHQLNGFQAQDAKTLPVLLLPVLTMHIHSGMGIASDWPE